MESNPSSSLDKGVALLTSLVYFVQGALSLSAVAFPLLLRKGGWTIPEIATFSFVIGLPWTLKIIYGATSDAVPMGGLRRKPYVILASLLSIASWLGLAFNGESKVLLYAFALAANLGFAVTDVVTDALIVEHSTESTTQVYQSLAWGWRSAGAIVGGVLGGWLAGHASYRVTFVLTGLLSMSTLIVGYFIREERTKRLRSFSHFWTPLTEGLRSIFQGDLKWFCLLLIVGTFSASISTLFFFFLKEKLGFRETFLGSLSSVAWLGAVIGCFLYAKIFQHIPMKTTLRWAVWLNAINILTTFCVIGRWSAVMFSFFGGVLGYLGLLPLMAAAALLSRKKGIEGSLFALLMSVNNLGQLVATFIGGNLFGIIGIPGLILLSTAVSLAGLFLIGKLKTV